MKNFKKRILGLTILALIVNNACNLPSASGTPVADLGAQLTAANMTVAANLTESAGALPTPTATQQVIPPTRTQVVVLPTRTPVPTNTNVPTRTSIPIPCDSAQFIEDVTIPDGTKVPPGARFSKVWRIKNIGSCTWTTDYDLVFVDGDGLNAAASTSLPEKVYPGETVDLSSSMIAPNESGDYRGYWRLRSSNGTTFGVGSEARLAYWVDISVIEELDDYAFDFATNLCTATWRTGAGALTCPSTTTNTNDGYVRYSIDPDLENRHENEPTIIAHPDNEILGWIMGKYPAFDVEDGDHFEAWIGCLDDSHNCDVLFKLEYQIDGGSIITLAEWSETYDGEITIVDLDLSSLAGESVQFILSVVTVDGNPRNANAFWFVPRISR
ncbi:MAG: hypothetical protein FVQ83_10215 [Chloroflexi bacterium]|nr:hypothetical protein [Chloroflexota bacterium]